MTEKLVQPEEPVSKLPAEETETIPPSEGMHIYETRHLCVCVCVCGGGGGGGGICPLGISMPHLGLGNNSALLQ